MERPGVMKLRWPVRIFEIELSRSLAKPCDFRQSKTRIRPIDFEAGAPRIGFHPFVTEHFSKFGHSFPVSGDSFTGCLVTITIDTEGCVTRAVTMHCHRHVDIRYAQVHWRQLGIKLDRVDDQGIDRGRLE